MWKENLLTSLRTKKIPLLLASSGIVFILIGIVGMFISENNSGGVIIEESASTERSVDSSTRIVVDVSGAVLKPGVHKLASDARIQEALIAAGGLADNADREYISKNINLALKISDGAKIYIPAKGESITRSASSGQASITGLININTASLSELDTLSGVGPVTAQKIIDSRPYVNIEDIVAKKVMGQKAFEKIREKISVY